MPHLTLEYTDNLAPFDAKVALRAMNLVLLACGQFEEADIKSRAQRLDDYVIGSLLLPRGFVHVQLDMLDGRSLAMRRQLAGDLLNALRQSGNWPTHLDVQCSVDVQEMSRSSYAKTAIVAALATS